MSYTKEELEKKDLLKYIDFQAICEDFNLDEGGLSPEQHLELEDLLMEFIIQNKWETEYNYEKKHWDDLATWNERFTD